MSGINYPARREIYQIFLPARASRGFPIGGIVHDGAPSPLEITGRGSGSGTISGRALPHGIAKGGAGLSRECLAEKFNSYLLSQDNGNRGLS